MQTKATKGTVLVAWSGGLDSTALIDRLLTEGYAVDAIYCQFANSFAKTKRELRAMRIMEAKYFKNYNFRRLTDCKIDGGTMGNVVSFAQFTPWIATLLMTVTPNHVKVAVGYVMNDDAISYLDEFRAVWKSYESLCSNDNLPPLEFPLAKVSKVSLWNGLPDVLRNNITWCENPLTGDRCTQCVPCRRMISLGYQRVPTEDEIQAIKLADSQRSAKNKEKKQANATSNKRAPATSARNRTRKTPVG